LLGSTSWGSTDLMPQDLELVEYSPEWGFTGFTAWKSSGVYSLEVYRSFVIRFMIWSSQNTHSHWVYTLGVYHSRSKVWGSSDLMLPSLGLLENSFKLGSTPWRPSGDLQISGHHIWIWLGVYSLGLYRCHATTFDSWILAEYSFKWGATVWGSTAGVCNLGVCRFTPLSYERYIGPLTVPAVWGKLNQTLQMIRAPKY